MLAAFDTTGTFKVQKSRLRSEGADPRAIDDAMFLRTDNAYVPLTPELYDRVKKQDVRL